MGAYSVSRSKNNSARICLIVDNPLRDLDGLTLLGWHLVRKNAEVFLVSMSNKYEVFFIRPDLVLLNYVRKGNQKFINLCKQLGILVAVLDTEGGVLKDVDLVFNNVFKYVNSLDLYCLWGLKQYEALNKINRLPRNSIKATGCPRYDFCVPPWSDTLQDIPVSSGNKTVLINTNFPVIQPRFQSPEKEAKELVSDAGFDKDYISELLSQTRQARDEVVKTVKHIAAGFPDVVFIVRPHPFEDKSYYISIFKDFPNVEVHQSGAVFPWIKNSAVMLHHNCATAIEAVLMRKEPVHLGWFNTPLLTQPSSVDMSVEVQSLGELEDLLRNVLSGHHIDIPDDKKEKRKQIIQDWFYSNDGKNAERVSDAIFHTIKNDRKRISNFRLIKALLLDQLLKNDLRTALKHLVILLIGSCNFSRLKKMRYASGKEFNVQDIQSLISRIEKVADDSGSSTVEVSSDEHVYIKYAIRLTGRIKKK